MNLTLGRDINGNKVLKVKSIVKGERGFSVQTLGSLPRTHQMIPVTFERTTAASELNAYVRDYGTKYQKWFLNIL